MKHIPVNLFLPVNLFIVLGSCQEKSRSDIPVRPGNPEWPRAWVTDRVVDTMEKDFTDLKRHGVSLVSIGERSVDDARKKLVLARKHGMKYHIQFNKMNERRDLILEMGLEPWESTWIIGENSSGLRVKSDEAETFQQKFENEIKLKGLLKNLMVYKYKCD
jgi:hypothetical protein